MEADYIMKRKVWSMKPDQNMKTTYAGFCMFAYVFLYLFSDHAVHVWSGNVFERSVNRVSSSFELNVASNL